MSVLERFANTGKQFMGGTVIKNLGSGGDFIIKY
jgi:hypothetical protein